MNNKAERDNIETALVCACEYLDGDGVSSVMRIYPDNEQVQEGCCRAFARTLEIFASVKRLHPINNAQWLDRMGNRVGKSDETVLAAMRSFSENKYIQIHGCKIVLHLFCLTFNPNYFIRLGAIDVVIAAMNEFPTEQLIQTYGVDTINIVAQTKDTLDVPRVCGVVISAMAGSGHSVPKQTCAMVTLSILFSRHLYDTGTVMRMGVAETIVATMRMFPGVVDIQFAALKSFECLGITSYYINTFVQGGVVDVMFAAMRAFPTVEALQSVGLYMFVRIILQHEADLTALVQAGLSEVVFSAVKRFWSNKTIVSHVCIIVREVLLKGRLPNKMELQFRPVDSTSVYGTIEVIREKLLAVEEGDENSSFFRQIERLTENLWNREVIEPLLS